MKKSIILGLLLCVIGIFASYIIGELIIILKINGVIALILIFLAGVFANVMGDGDRVRANFSTEAKEDRQERMKWSSYFLLISLPNLILSGIILFELYS